VRSAVSFCLGAAVGAAAAHLLDPERGASRRSQLRDRASSVARRGASGAQAQAQQAADRVEGAAASAVPTGPRLEDPDDVTLVRKVETEIFRGPDVPKGGVSIDVQAGVAHLRGEVPDAAWIGRLGEAAAAVEGIRGVQNLLHVAGTPTPTAESPERMAERLGSE
jgi:osmotically-inducible protein OsmY